MRVMKVICTECGADAKIKKTARRHKHFADLYCSCSEPECGHTFVMNLTFSHTLSPSAMTHGRMVKDIADSIHPDQREAAAAFLTRTAKETRETERQKEETNGVIITRR